MVPLCMVEPFIIGTVPVFAHVGLTVNAGIGIGFMTTTCVLVPGHALPLVTVNETVYVPGAG
jgi:hypothetical protein